MHRDAISTRPLSSRTRHVPSASPMSMPTAMSMSMSTSVSMSVPMSTPAWCRRR
ncbi:hypothetical protein ACFQ80_01510 [Isoptericola sp. NPDC056578]|uniref:hypothetical protein n=1 Tax=Isoptericola sp. NPDC056578 TaxID=3345870 RepID=UPI0036C8E5C0